MTLKQSASSSRMHRTQKLWQAKTCEMPEARALRKIDWQVFATLTFARAGIAEHIRRSMLFAWLRKLCKAQRVYFPDLPFCCRFEWGASGPQHGHYHLVITGLPNLTAVTCGRAEALWRKRGGGFGRVAIYDPSRDGVGYLLKLPRHSAQWSPMEDDSQIPMLSEGLTRILRRLPM